MKISPPKLMQAMVVRAPMQFDIEKVPVPNCPEKGLLLRVKACGLCGSDLRTLRDGHRQITFPWIIGHEVSGIVAQTGPQYHGDFQTGDHLAVAPVVYCGKCIFCQNGQFELCQNYLEIAQKWPGGFAEYMALPAEALERGTIRYIPNGLNFELAAIAEPISSCIHAQEKGKVGLGDVVVIIGAGPIGCIHASLARIQGADQIILADVQAPRLEQANKFKADVLINASEVNLVEKVHELTAGYGADVVITANPVPDTQIQAVEMAKKGGRILLFGGLPGGQSKPGIDMNRVHYHALTLIGTTIFAPRHHAQALKLLRSGKINGEKLVTYSFPLAQFKTGVRLAFEGKVLKAVFRCE